MRLILLSDVKDLGKKGEVVEVTDGFARNFLLPKKKAMKASEGAMVQAERLRSSREGADRKARDAAEAVAVQLAGARVVLAAQAGDEGKLYGSIGIGDVVEGVRRFTGVELERKVVEITNPIKAIGLHEVWVRLHPQVEFPITLDVIPA